MWPCTNDNYCIVATTFNKEKKNMHKKTYNPKYLEQQEADAKNATKKTRLTVTKRKT